MKTNRLIIYTLCLILLTACAYDEEEIKEAWASCDSATGSASGLNVSGKIYEIDSINSNQPFFNINDHNEEHPSYDPKYIDDHYNNFTRDLSKASSVLCIKLKTTLLKTCNYPSDQKVQFTLKYYHTEANLILLSWPSKELIVQDKLTSKPIDDLIINGINYGLSCPSTILYESGEKSRNMYELIDLDGWLEQYVTITE